MANQWFKFYGGEYLSDPKIERLSPLERSCWLTLLCLASMNGIGEIKFLTIESLLNKSGIQFNPYQPEEWEKALSVLTRFKKMEMIDLNDEGDIFIKNWEKRQEHNLTVAERVAKSRLKKKNVTNNVTNVTTEENRIDKNRIKNTYGEFKNILLYDEEHKKLIEKLGPEITTSLIEQLGGYIASKGKRYHSHYATILNWSRPRADKPKRKIV